MERRSALSLYLTFRKVLGLMIAFDVLSMVPNTWYACTEWEGFPMVPTISILALQVTAECQLTCSAGLSFASVPSQAVACACHLLACAKFSSGDPECCVTDASRGHHANTSPVYSPMGFHLSTARLAVLRLSGGEGSALCANSIHVLGRGATMVGSRMHIVTPYNPHIVEVPYFETAVLESRCTWDPFELNGQFLHSVQVQVHVIIWQLQVGTQVLRSLVLSPENDAGSRLVSHQHSREEL